MITEPVNTEQDPQPTEKPNEPENWRELPGAKALANNAKEAQERAAKIEAEYKEYKAKLAAEQKAAEEQRLVEQGEYKTLAEQVKAELEAREAAHAAELRRRDITTALVKAGLTNDIALAGAVSMCPADAEINTWVEQLRNDHASLFSQSQTSFTPGEKPPQGAPSGGPQKSLKERLAARDEETMKDVFWRTLAGETVQLD